MPGDGRGTGLGLGGMGGGVLPPGPGGRGRLLCEEAGKAAVRVSAVKTANKLKTAKVLLSISNIKNNLIILQCGN